MSTAPRADAKSPREEHDKAEQHLSRGLAIAKLMHAFAWEYEMNWNTSDPFTLYELSPHDLVMVCEVMTEELETAKALLRKLDPNPTRL